jgi:phage shock protein E
VNLDPVIGAVLAALVLYVALRALGGRKVASKTVAERIKAGASIVDVRTPDEFRDGAYPGAINIPLGSLASRMNELTKDKPIVLYCESGARSGMAARMLRRAGFADVLNAGGLCDMPR